MYWELAGRRAGGARDPWEVPQELLCSEENSVAESQPRAAVVLSSTGLALGLPNAHQNPGWHSGCFVIIVPIQVLPCTNFSLCYVLSLFLLCCEAWVYFSCLVRHWQSAGGGAFTGDVHSATAKLCTLTQGHIHGRSDTLLITSVPSASFWLGTIHGFSSMQLCILSLNTAEGSKSMGLPFFFFSLILY